jgi:hypothetical protein
MERGGDADGICDDAVRMRRKSDIARYYCLKFPHQDQAFGGTNAAFSAYFAAICI